jgi:D-alanine-D-alanine ligase
VLAGGQSTERAVSLASGRCVAQALRRLGHRVSLIDPVDADIEPVQRRFDSPAELPRFEPVMLEAVDWSRFDAVFLALHGGAGEDGRVQRLLEDRQVPFTGPGSASAQRAMSKLATKQALRAAGVPTPEDAPFDADTPIDWLAAQAAAIGFPVVVKPDAQGSSLGVGLAHDLVDLVACRDEVLRLDRQGLVEPFIEGREFTVSIVGREVLPTVEVLAGGPLFSFADKYGVADEESGRHRRAVDDLPAATISAIRRAALATADVLETRGLVRVDLRLDEIGEPWILELNAIPGLTPTSVAPFAAGLAGWTMEALCERLVRDCLRDFSPSESTTASIAATI